jgi:hypothetical protein
MIKEGTCAYYKISAVLSFEGDNWHVLALANHAAEVLYLPILKEGEKRGKEARKLTNMCWQYEFYSATQSEIDSLWTDNATQSDFDMLTEVDNDA